MLVYSRVHRFLALAASLVVIAASTHAAQTTLVHKSSIDLGNVFNSTTGYGDNPLSVAFDGTNAYVGGYKSTTGSPGTVGIVKVENVVGGGLLNLNPLAPSLFASPTSRGIDALDFHGDSIYLAHDSGSAATSFIGRRQATDGDLGGSGWTVANPQSSRPFALAIDPLGNNGAPGVGFLTQGSGRRRLLALDGTTVWDGSNGAIVNGSPTFFGTAWRALTFDSNGQIALTEDSGFQYGTRVAGNFNRFQTIDATLDRTSSSLAKNSLDGNSNNVGQGIAILEGLGSDLLAVSARSADMLTPQGGAAQTIASTSVHIRNLDGTSTGLSQIELKGDENGIGTPWTSNIKNLAFGVDGAGTATLLVLDFGSRRLDVYQVPEPQALLLVVMGSLALLRRRATRRV